MLRLAILGECRNKSTGILCTPHLSKVRCFNPDNIKYNQSVLPSKIQCQIWLFIFIFITFTNLHRELANFCVFLSHEHEQFLFSPNFCWQTLSQTDWSCSLICIHHSVCSQVWTQILMGYERTYFLAIPLLDCSQLKVQTNEEQNQRFQQVNLISCYSAVSRMSAFWGF